MTALSPGRPVRRTPRRTYSAIPGEAAGSPPWRAAKSLILLVCVLLVAIPFVAVLATSLADTGQLNSTGGFVLWPDRPNLGAYRAILGGGIVSRAMLVSVGITVVGTLLSLAASIGLAYGLSRRGTFGQRPILLMLVLSLLFVPGVIPSYLLIKNLGLIDSYWSLILPTLINAFNVIVLRSFFTGLPGELIDAARIDGAGEWNILTRIVLPLSKASVAVVGLFYAVSYWNAFFNALIYVNDSAKWPMQLVLRTYVVNNAAISQGQTADPGAALPPTLSLQAAILILSVLPIAVIYPFLQRHMGKGVMVGAVKG